MSKIHERDIKDDRRAHKVYVLDTRRLKAYQKTAARTLYRKKMGNANKAEACI